jgi:hypothetical protein
MICRDIANPRNPGICCAPGSVCCGGGNTGFFPYCCPQGSTCCAGGCCGPGQSCCGGIGCCPEGTICTTIFGRHVCSPI